MEPAEERQNLVADGSDESNGSDRTAGNGEAKSFVKVFVGQAGASFFFICCWFTASLTLSLYNKVSHRPVNLKRLPSTCSRLRITILNTHCSPPRCIP